MQSWKSLLPDYQLRRWDQTNSPLNNSFTRVAYSGKQWSRLSNYVRLHALYTEGGVYLDTDVEVVKGLTPLLADPCFLGFQQQEKQSDWVNTAVLGAVPGHGFLELCMERIVDRFEQTGRFERNPAIMTRILEELGLASYGFQRLHDVVIYPVEYFYPYSWLEKYSPEKIRENTYCVHHWAATWKGRISFELPAPLRRLKRAVVAWIQRRF